MVAFRTSFEGILVGFFCIRKKRLLTTNGFTTRSVQHRCRENGVMIPLVSFWEVATLKVQIHSEVSEKGT